MKAKSIFLLAFVCIAAVSCTQPGNKATSLKEAYADSFKMGCAINPFMVNGRNPEATELLLKHFNALSPDNAMKPESLHPGPDVWNFGPADSYVAF
ncbi:MAG: endo-1,4-beta-xylanase, partial [Bacteroidales bacterium]|nr:endo-1,4-beta-xylanase [Bacteroidales bacterium]